MKLLNPSLTLCLDEKETIITSDFIVKDSIIFNYQLLNELSSSSNRVNLQLLRTSSAIKEILQSNEDIKAVLKDGSTTLFTGYLSTDFSFSVTLTGASCLNITLEDVGTRLLQKPFIQTGEHFFSCSLSEALVVLTNKAGVLISPNCLYIEDELITTIKAEKTIKELLDSILKEYLLAYYFDEFGNLMLYDLKEINKKVPIVMDSKKLYSSSSSVINLSKKLRSYQDARVSYKELKTAKNYLIYSNTTGRDSSHPFCKLVIPSKHIFDGAEIHTVEDDSFLVPPLTKAVNAKSETEIVASSDIIAINNLKLETNSIMSFSTIELKALGGSYFSLLVKNETSQSDIITRLDVYADISYESDTNIITTSINSDKCKDEELVYIHTKDKATSYANFIKSYYKESSASYSFYSKEDLTLGSVIRLQEDVFTGLSVDIVLTQKHVKSNSAIASYSGFALTHFNLDEKIISQKINKPNVDDKGKDGTSFTTIITSNNGNVFRPNNIDTILSCKVYKNLEDITDTLPSSSFNWIRKTEDKIQDESWNTLSKAIGKKTIHITNQDCINRTVFDCIVKLK